MDLDQLVNTFTDTKKNTDVIFRTLRQISRLDEDRAANFRQIQSRMVKISDMTGRMEPGSRQVASLRTWVDEYAMQLEEARGELGRRFGVELEQRLEEMDRSLSGHYPELRTGLFTVELDFDKGHAILWYGPKQEPLGRYRLSPREVAGRVQKSERDLGSGLPLDEFLARLEEAWLSCIDGKRSRKAPIIQVLCQLSFLLQTPHFRSDPKKANYKGYGRADFSFDLFRVRREADRTRQSNRLHLAIATRSQTEQRGRHLWIPEGADGRGSAYSHITFSEEAVS